MRSTTADREGCRRICQTTQSSKGLTWLISITVRLPRFCIALAGISYQSLYRKGWLERMEALRLPSAGFRLASFITNELDVVAISDVGPARRKELIT